jgi:hypothetical protein
MTLKFPPRIEDRSFYAPGASRCNDRSCGLTASVERNLVPQHWRCSGPHACSSSVGSMH